MISLSQAYGEVGAVHATRVLPKKYIFRQIAPADSEFGVWARKAPQKHALKHIVESPEFAQSFLLQVRLAAAVVVGCHRLSSSSSSPPPSSSPSSTAFFPLSFLPRLTNGWRHAFNRQPV